MALQNFAKSLTFTLSFEGGKANNPKDPGGKTNKGITQHTYTTWLKANGHQSKDVFNITDQEVGLIYQHDYWNAIGAGGLPSGVDVIAFDIAVNSGTGLANKWLTQTKTLAPKARIKALHAKRCGFWRALSIFRVFGSGWLRRETACLTLSLSVA